MHDLISIKSASDLPGIYRETPIELLFRYHNLKQAHDTYSDAKLFVAMCMDRRKRLHIPDNFAFIIRSGGANMKHSEFKLSYAIGIGQINCVALIAHTECGMVNIHERKNQFIEGMVERAGWEQKEAEEYFAKFSPVFEIGNEVDFVVKESKRLRDRYPKVLVAPLIYKVEDNLLYLVKEE